MRGSLQKVQLKVQGSTSQMSESEDADKAKTTKTFGQMKLLKQFHLLIKRRRA